MSGIALQVTLEQMNQAKRLMASTTLESVRLVHVRAANMAVAGCPVKSVAEQQMPTMAVSLIPSTNRFSVLFGHAIRGQRGPEENTEVQVDASFELVYSFPKELDPPPTKDELQAFAEINAVMNCWPYWRELVQTTVGRMNLPPLVVPLIRWVPPKPVAPKNTDVQAKGAIAETKKINAPVKVKA